MLLSPFYFYLLIVAVLLWNVDAFSISGRLRYANRNLKMVDQETVKNLYTQFLESNGLLTDMITVLISNTVSDSIAQVTEKQNVIDIPAISTATLEAENIATVSSSVIDLERVKRFAIFGFFDGAVGHNWFVALDQVIKGNDGLSVVYKIIADTVVFTPVWVAWFLLGMGSVILINYNIYHPRSNYQIDILLICCRVLEGNLQKKIETNKIKTEYKELLYIDLG